MGHSELRCTGPGHLLEILTDFREILPIRPGILGDELKNKVPAHLPKTGPKSTGVNDKFSRRPLEVERTQFHA